MPSGLTQGAVERKFKGYNSSKLIVRAGWQYLFWVLAASCPTTPYPYYEVKYACHASKDPGSYRTTSFTTGRFARSQAGPGRDSPGGQSLRPLPYRPAY